MILRGDDFLALPYLLFPHSHSNSKYYFLKQKKITHDSWNGIHSTWALALCTSAENFCFASVLERKTCYQNINDKVFYRQYCTARAWLNPLVTATRTKLWSIRPATTDVWHERNFLLMKISIRLVSYLITNTYSFPCMCSHSIADVSNENDRRDHRRLHKLKDFKTYFSISDRGENVWLTHDDEPQYRSVETHVHLFHQYHRSVTANM